MNQSYRVVAIARPDAPPAVRDQRIQERGTIADAVRAHPRLGLVETLHIHGDTRNNLDVLEGLLAKVRPEIVALEQSVGLAPHVVALSSRYGIQGIIAEMPEWKTPVDVGGLYAVLHRSTVKLLVPHIRRCMPAFRYAKARYLDGTVGEPMFATAGIARNTGNWHGGHWLDLLRFLHNDDDIAWVFGHASPYSGADPAETDHIVGYFQFARGAKALLDAGSAMVGKDSILLAGTRGCIRIRNEHTVLVETMERSRKRSFAADPESYEVRCWHNVLNEYVDWLEGGPEPELAYSTMEKSFELHLAVLLSARRGDRIDLPLNGDARSVTEAFARQAGPL